MTVEPFIPKKEISFDAQQSGEVTAESPSNIALVKYWGKKENQIPTNPSISYTLSKSKTSTLLQFSPKKGDKQEIHVFLDGVETPSFIKKIDAFIQKIQIYCPWINAFDYTIKTQNTFPHSSGIASSASGMSALAKCFMQIEKRLYNDNYSAPKHKLSFLSRLGSGSACRSVFPGLVEWGDSEFVPNSSNLYAVPLTSKINPIFKSFKDCILLIHEGQKTVSSTLGHSLMNNHPYADKRFSEAKKNIGKLVDILKTDNIAAFGDLIEHEALSLHAVMLTSQPAFILMQPNTLAAINEVWKFRQTRKLPLYFTLDAGANIHLLYPEKESIVIEHFIKNSLLKYSANGKAIFDSLAF